MAETALNTPREQNFSLGNLLLAGRRWGGVGGRPIIALHGWIDNCASFDLLAPLLSGADLLCLDCAGHGLSGHRTLFGAYNIWQDVGELFAVADQLGWKTFSLIGHSRGAMAAFMAAGTFPERIERLVLLEGAAPKTAPAEAAPDTLAQAIKTLKASRARAKQFYETFERAVQARAQGVLPIDEADARTLAQRGVVQTEQGFSWCYDHQLLAGSELRLSWPQVDAFAARIRAPTLLVAADQGLLHQDTELTAWLRTQTAWQQRHLPGGHHFHMHAQAAALAPMLRQHLLLG